MVIGQPIDGPLDDLAHRNAFALANVAKHGLEVVGNGTDKVDRYLLVVVVTLDVYVNERLESFLQQ